MIVGRIVLLALLSACAGAPQADVRWLINENTEQVMGLVGRGAVGEQQRYVLLECASYDLFVVAHDAYQRRADEQLPRGCRELVNVSLSREQLRASKQEMVAKLKQKQLLAGLLDDLSEGMSSGAAFSFLGLSGRHSKTIAKIVAKLKGLDILPQIPAQGKIKKGLLILSAAAMLITSSGILKRKEHEHYQTILDELSGAQYPRRMQDQETAQESYEEIKRLLTVLVGEQGKRETPAEVASLPRVVAN